MDHYIKREDVEKAIATIRKTYLKAKITSSIVYAVLPIAAMRSGVAATVSYNGLSLISGADTVVDYTSVTALEQTDSTVQLAFMVSGQTPGAVYRLRLMDSNAYLAVSKEL